MVSLWHFGKGLEMSARTSEVEGQCLDSERVFQSMKYWKEYFVDNETTKTIAIPLKDRCDSKDCIYKELRIYIIPETVIYLFYRLYFFRNNCCWCRLGGDVRIKAGFTQVQVACRMMLKADSNMSEANSSVPACERGANRAFVSNVGASTRQVHRDFLHVLLNNIR